MQNDEYISRFSHELRNPLTLIYSSLQLLEKECPAVRESALWEPLKKDMCDVIQLLKDMSAPFGSFQPVPIPLADLFPELSASFAPDMELRGICFATELPDELSGVTVTADRKKLRQAVTNLIVNAADAVSSRCETASSEDKIRGKIQLSAAMEGQDLCIHVRDNGPGIPREYLADLFDPFVTHKSAGTGLGLSISSKIAEQHGGSLTVETCCGACGADSATYTDFCLRLPSR